MRLPLVVSDGRRTAGHWIVMALIAIAALAYVTLIWIEGPSYVYFLLMFWALAAAPLLLAAHARSGSQALRRAALYVAIASFGLALVSASSTDYNAWSLLFAALGVAVPLYASYRAIRRVYAARPAPPTPQTSRGREAITFGVITAVSGLALTPTWNLEVGSKLSANDAFISQHAGCYQLSVGARKPQWMPNFGPGLRVPQRVRLDTVRGRDIVYRDTMDRRRVQFERNHLLVRPGARYGSAFWRPIASDRIELVWTTGHTGMTLLLQREGDAYTGAGQDFTDMQVHPPNRDRVRAERIDCALVPPDSARVLP